MRLCVATILIFSLSGAGVCRAGDQDQSSLFFTAKEVRLVRESEKKTPDVADSDDIRVGAVIVYSSEDWVVWIQGQRWTPETKNDDIRILSVEPDLVYLSVRSLAGAPDKEIALRPYQTYRISSGEVAGASPPPSSVEDNLSSR